MQIAFEVCVRVDFARPAMQPRDQLADSAGGSRPFTGALSIAPLRFNRRANFSELRLSRGGARKIRFRPQEPGAHPLILRQGFVHARDDPSGVARVFHTRLIAQKQYAAGLRVARALEPYDHAILHFRFAAQ